VSHHLSRQLHLLEQSARVYRAEDAIKIYWELKGKTIDTLLLTHGDSPKRLNKTVQTSGLQNDSNNAIDVLHTPQQLHAPPIFILPYEVAELHDAHIKKSNVEGLSRLSHRLRSIELGLGPVPLLSMYTHRRIHKMRTLLDDLANAQQYLRSSLHNLVLER
jgi:hypothetical protein